MKIFAIVAVIVLSFVGLMVLCIHADEKSDREWREYVAVHHCKIASSPYLDETVWACEGFEVKHP